MRFDEVGFMVILSLALSPFWALGMVLNVTIPFAPAVGSALVWVAHPVSILLGLVVWGTRYEGDIQVTDYVTANVRVATIALGALLLLHSVPYMPMGRKISRALRFVVIVIATLTHGAPGPMFMFGHLSSALSLLMWRLSLRPLVGSPWPIAFADTATLCIIMQQATMRCLVNWQAPSWRFELIGLTEEFMR
jgi:hypothetical protein